MHSAKRVLLCWLYATPLRTLSCNPFATTHKSSKLVYGNHYSTRPTTFPKLSGDSFAALCSAASCMLLRWTQQGERITEQTPCHPLFPPLSRARCWFMFVSYYDDRQGLCVQENETLPRLFLFSCMCTFACASILMSNLQEDGISVLALLYMHAISCACQDHCIPHYTGISLLRLRTFVEVRTKKRIKWQRKVRQSYQHQYITLFPSFSLFSWVIN